jgi:phosphoglycolate phosphatase
MNNSTTIMSEQSTRTPTLFTAVLFDLDGTLTDSAPGITESLAGALEEIGRPISDPADLLSYVGPPLRDTFVALGLDEAQAAAATLAYRSRADLTDLQNNAVFPGMIGLLRALREAGVAVALATSKPVARAERILEHFGLLPYFDVVGGSDDPRGIVTKTDVIASVRRALDEQGRDTRHVVMVGDRSHDIAGAQANGIPAVIVEWGYGSPDRPPRRTDDGRVAQPRVTICCSVHVLPSGSANVTNRPHGWSSTGLASIPPASRCSRAASASATTICTLCCVPTGISVSPLPNAIEQADPGGVICTNRTSSLTVTS